MRLPGFLGAQGDLWEKPLGAAQIKGAIEGHSTPLSSSVLVLTEGATGFGHCGGGD